MNDFISREELFKRFQKQAMALYGKDSERYQMVMDIMDGVRFAPSVDAAPVVHAHWITYADDKRECYCSNCKFPAGLDAYGYHNMQDPYCRFCGAKMDER